MEVLESIGPDHPVLPEAYSGGLWYNNRKKMTYINIVDIEQFFGACIKNSNLLEKRFKVYSSRYSGYRGREYNKICSNQR